MTAPFMPNLKVRAGLHLTPAHQLPDGQPVALVFNCPAVPALATEQVSLNVPPGDVVVWAITANSTVAGTSFRMQLYHGHGQVQRQFFNKALPAGLVAGSGSRPLMLRDTYFFGAGDVISVEVHNTAGTAADIQIVLWAVRPQ